MKRRITESQLKKMVSESVKKVLINELDSRTLVSAAAEYEKRQQPDKAIKMRAHAANEWNKEYGNDTRFKRNGVLIDLNVRMVPSNYFGDYSSEHYEKYGFFHISCVRREKAEDGSVTIIRAKYNPKIERTYATVQHSEPGGWSNKEKTDYDIADLVKLFYINPEGLDAAHQMAYNNKGVTYYHEVGEWGPNVDPAGKYYTKGEWKDVDEPMEDYVSESRLHKIVNESIRKVIKENGGDKRVGVHVTTKKKEELMDGLFPYNGSNIDKPMFGDGVYMTTPDGDLSDIYGTTFVYVDLDKLENMGIGLKKYTQKHGIVYVADYVPKNCIINIVDKRMK